jgi:hypothetical protein
MKKTKYLIAIFVICFFNGCGNISVTNTTEIVKETQKTPTLEDNKTTIKKEIDNSGEDKNDQFQIKENIISAYKVWLKNDELRRSPNNVNFNPTGAYDSTYINNKKQVEIYYKMDNNNYYGYVYVPSDKEGTINHYSKYQFAFRDDCFESDPEYDIMANITNLELDSKNYTYLGSEIFTLTKKDIEDIEFPTSKNPEKKEFVKSLYKQAITKDLHFYGFLEKGEYEVYVEDFTDLDMDSYAYIIKDGKEMWKNSVYLSNNTEEVMNFSDDTGEWTDFNISYVTDNFKGNFQGFRETIYLNSEQLKWEREYLNKISVLHFTVTLP